jgi:WD40 repeat protein
MMLYTPFDSTIPENPKTLYPFVARFITLAAAVLIVALVGGLLVEMVSDPVDGYPALISLQTEEPKCAAASVTDATAESMRLAEAAQGLIHSLQSEASLAPESVEQPLLLSVCALQTAYTREADVALQAALQLGGYVPAFKGNAISGGVFSPDGRYLLTADGSVAQRWDLSTGSKVQDFTGHTDGISALSYSNDGRYVLTGSFDKTARLWDAETGKSLMEFIGHTNELSSVSLSPDGRYVLTSASVGMGTTDNTARIWDATTGAELREFPNAKPIFAAAFSPDGQYVATAGWDASVRLWNAETGEEIRRFSSHLPWASGAVFSPDGLYLLSGGADNRLLLSDVATGEDVREFKSDSERIFATVAYSRDGRSVLGGARDALLALLWNADTGTLQRTFDLSLYDVKRLFNVTFSPDSQLVAVGTQGEPDMIRVFNAPVDSFIAGACAHVTRDFTAEERAQYGLGEGAACP